MDGALHEKKSKRCCHFIHSKLRFDVMISNFQRTANLFIENRIKTFTRYRRNKHKQANNKNIDTKMLFYEKRRGNLLGNRYQAAFCE